MPTPVIPHHVMIQFITSMVALTIPIASQMVLNGLKSDSPMRMTTP